MKNQNCPDCNSDVFVNEIPRRAFMKSSALATAGLVTGGISSLAPNFLRAEEKAVTEIAAKAVTTKSPETLVKVLYESLSPKQKETIAFEWDHVDPKRGLLRTRVENNWMITGPSINDDFYTKDQRHIVREIFKGIVHPDWIKRIDQQIEDDMGGFGHDQAIALFGKPDNDKFEFVYTGRHITIRCDGNSTANVAFGGPIFYGHAVQDNEKPDHPGNVFWPQAVAANKIYTMFDSKQREQALVRGKTPREQAVGFRKSGFPGLAVKDMSSDQQAELQKVLQLLIEPYRQTDRDEALAALKKQGGLEKCSLGFYESGDIGGDKVWDNWRLEGPAFVWYFRGSPHVHVWVNVADDPGVKLNA